MIPMRHMPILCLLFLAVFALILLGAKCNAGIDRMQREDEAAFVARRNSDPDATACRARGGIPVWGNGWSHGTGEVVDCKPLPSPSK